ncbi:MAG: hypothetical protein Q4C12_06265 [Clostridia bacterium]|nr:hypothetical protein [Clostridia bacterium]
MKDLTEDEKALLEAYRSLGEEAQCFSSLLLEWQRDNPDKVKSVLKSLEQSAAEMNESPEE